MKKSDSKMPETSEVEFHILKSSLFRTINCDGVMGANGPDGRIHLVVFSERYALPQKIVMSTINGELENEILEKRESKSGIIRDVEANLVLSLDAAISLYEFLHVCLEDASKADLIEKIETGEPLGE